MNAPLFRTERPTRRFRPARPAPMTLALALASVFLTLASVAVGYAPFDLVAAAGDRIAGRETLAALVLWELRLPRALLGGLVGFSLGLTGAVMQGFLRNPLADPGILGISSAAALGAVIVFYGGLAGLYSITEYMILGCAAQQLQYVWWLWSLHLQNMLSRSLVAVGDMDDSDETS